MFIGPCIIVITEESKTSQIPLLFYCTVITRLTSDPANEFFG